MPFNLNSSVNDPITIVGPVTISNTLNVSKDVTVNGDSSISGNVTFGKLTCGSDSNSVTSEQFSSLIERVDYSLAKPKSLSFNNLSYPRNDNNKIPDLMARADVWSNAKMNVTYENNYVEYPTIVFKPLLNTGEPLPKTNGTSGEYVIPGQIYDGSGNIYRDVSGNGIVSGWTDGTSLINLPNPTVTFGENYNTLFMVNQYESIDPNKAENFSSLSPVNIITIKQHKKSGELTAVSCHNVDTKAVKGLQFTCASSVTPWNTHLSSEEYPFNAWAWHCYKNGIQFKKPDGTPYLENSSTMWGGDNLFKYFIRLNQYMFGKFDSSGDTLLSPYNWGWTPEVTVNPNGTGSIVKHYSMGRFSHEIAVVMPDCRTVLFGNDSPSGVFHMYIADVSGNLSAGKLYAAKLTQTSASNGGSFTVQWILMGQATDAEIAGYINTVNPGDMYDLQARDSSGGYTVIDASGNSTYYPKTNDGYIKSRCFNDVSNSADQLYMKYIGSDMKAFAFLETRRCAEWLGATCETNKLEGCTVNIKDKIAYFAMSSGSGLNIIADSRGETDDMRISPISHGVVMKALLGGGYSTIQGSSRNTGFVQEAIDSVWVPYQLTGIPELRGSSSNGYMDTYIGDPNLGHSGSATRPANPDNLKFSEKLRTLFIGEDTSLRTNNLLWAHNVDTLQNSYILSTPFGTETTGLGVYDNLNGFSYCTASFQHIGDYTFPETETYFGPNAITNALIKRWGEKYTEVSSIGYIPLPYISDSKQVPVVAKQLELTDSSGTTYVLNGDLLRRLNALLV